MNAPLISSQLSAALGPGLQRTPVDEQKAATRAAVEELHEFADMLGLGRNRHGVPVANIARRAAVLLDEYQAGHYLATPSAQSGWVLVPATLLPKVGAAVEAMVAAMKSLDSVFDYDEEAYDAAIEGGEAVLALLGTVGANSFAQPTAHGRMNSPLREGRS